MIFPGYDMPAKTKAQRDERDAAYKAWLAMEADRVFHQRAWLTSYHNVIGDALIRAMLIRAEALLDMGEADAADALLEFVPESSADRFLEKYFAEYFEEPK